MRELLIDGELIHSKNDFYDAVRSQLSVPDYFGNNLDALHDIMTEYSEPVRLTIEHLTSLRKSLGSTYLMLLFTVMTESEGQILILS